MTEYLTAGAVRRAFEASGKRHLILTGARKSGKTTLLNRLCSEPLTGVTTWAVPGSAVYLRDNLTGETARIGIFDESLPGTENRMRPVKDGFLAVGISALNRISDSEWISIDEIGYLETECPEYCGALREVFGHRRVIAAVRKQEIPFLMEVLNREEAFVVDLDDPWGRAGCVMMASGLGRRFSPQGKVNKLTADFMGKPLILWAADSADGLFFRRTAVTRHREAVQICERNGIDTVLHDFPLRSDTVRLGIQAMADTERCMFCQGDQPLIGRETMEAMLLLSRNLPESIIRAGWEGNAASPVLFPEGMYEELLHLPDGKGGGYLAMKYPERVKILHVLHPAELKDADTPEDLAELEKIYREELQ